MNTFALASTQAHGVRRAVCLLFALSIYPRYILACVIWWKYGFQFHLRESEIEFDLNRYLLKPSNIYTSSSFQDRKISLH